MYVGGVVGGTEEDDVVQLIDLDGEQRVRSSGLRCLNRYGGHALSLKESIFSFGPQYTVNGPRPSRFALCLEELCGDRRVLHEDGMPDCFFTSAATTLEAQGALFLFGRHSLMYDSFKEVFIKVRTINTLSFCSLFSEFHSGSARS